MLEEPEDRASAEESDVPGGSLTEKIAFKWRDRKRAALRASSILQNRITFESLEPRLLLSADAAPIAGSIDVPGETDAFTFTLQAPKKIYFDSLSDSSLKWSLSGPGGALVTNRNLGSSDAGDISGSNVLDLQVGQYSLTVDGQGDATGAYGFRLLDLANAEHIASGQRVDQTMPGKQTALYQFDAIAGDKFFFDEHVLSGGSATYRILGPDQELIDGPDAFYGSSDPEVFTLNRTGSYTLAIEGYDFNTNPLTYGFTLSKVEERVDSFVLGDVVADRIATAGSSIRYDFDLGDRTKAVFDTLLRSDNFTWTLTGPRGTVIDKRLFQNSDLASSGSVLDLVAGSYSLTIRANGDRTGDFAFRLIDFAATTEIQPGDQLNEAIGDAGAAQSRERPAGAPIDYTGQPQTNRAWDGSRGGALRVDDSAALQPAQLTLEAWVKASGSYENLVSKDTSDWSNGYGLVATGGAIRFYLNGRDNMFVEAALDNGAWHHVAGTFDGAALKLYIDGVLAGETAFTGTIDHVAEPVYLGGTGSGNARLQGSLDDVRVWNTARTQAQLAQFLATPLTGAESGLLGYWAFDEASGGTAADLSPNAALATVVAERGTATRLYRFHAEQGEDFFLNVGSSSGSFAISVYGPDGTRIANPGYAADIDLENLDQGDYTIVLEGSYSNDFAAAFQLELVAVAVNVTALGLGSRIDGRIDPGQRNRYTVTLAEPRQLLFDALSDSGGLTWSLKGPRGVEFADRAFSYSDSYYGYAYAGNIELPAGDYEIVIDGNGDTAQDYSFRLLDKAAAQAINRGEEVAGAIDPSRETDLYTFQGAAGDTISIDRLVDDGSGDIYWRLFDPRGNRVSGPEYFSGETTVELNFTGTYTLAIEGAIWTDDTPDYSFQVNLTGTSPLPDVTEGTPINLGDGLSSSLAADGDEALFTFTVGGPTRVYFDSLSPDTSKRWTLVGTNGIEAGRNFYYSDSYADDDEVVISLPAAGTYQLRITGTAGDFGFRMLDLGATNAISADGSSHAGTLSPGNSTQVFSFEGTAGEPIVIAGNANYATYRIIDPFGRVIVGQSSFGQRTIELPSTGTYTLLVEGEVWYNEADYGDQSFSFSLSSPVVTPPQDLALGELVEGEISAAGEVDTYRLTLDSERVLVLDSRTSDYYFAWQIVGSGTSISGDLYDSDYIYTLPTVRLPAGEYEFKIQRYYGYTGSYAFKLLDTAAGIQVATDNSEIAGALAPANETDVYTFDAQAGDKFLFDARTVPASTQIRLLDPAGRDVSHYMGFSDRLLTMALTGRYTLLVEGNVWDAAASRDYSFALKRVVDPAPVALVVGETTEASVANAYEATRLRFTLTAATQLYLDSLTNNGQLNWTLKGPTGQIATDNFSGSDSFEDYGERVLKLVPGDYELVIAGSGANTGTARFRLVDLAAATAIDFGQTISGRLAPSNETDMYKFDAVEGEKFGFQNLLGVPNASMRIIDPQGHQIIGPDGVSNQEFVAERTGTYTILIEGRVSDATERDYRFTLRRPTTSVQALPLDGGLPGATLTPGKVGNALAFAGHEQLQIQDPALDIRDDVTIEFWVNPDRVTDTWTPLVYKGSDNSGGQQRSYSLWLNSSGYLHFSSFRGGSNDTLDTAGGAIAFGTWTHVAAVLERSTGTMKIYLNGVLAASRTGVSATPSSGSPDTPLYVSGTSEVDDSYGRLEGMLDELRVWDGGRSEAQIQANMLAGPPADTAGLVLRLGFDDLSQAGTTTEAVSGQGKPVLWDFADVDGTVSGRISAPGDVRSYTFHLDAATMLSFDALHDNSQLQVTLKGLGGVDVTRNLRNGDSHEFGGSNPVFAAEAGDYTVTVASTNGTTGAFAFRLLDLATAAAATLDSVVTGRLAGSDNDAYKFEVAPGQKVFIDAQQIIGASGDRLSIRLIDPYGRQVGGIAQFQDIETAALTVGGTYTLLVEGRAWRAWPIDYRLGIYAVNDAIATAITLAGANPSQPATTVGKPGNALTLRGVDYVEVPDSAAVSPTGSFTTEGWYKLDRYTDQWHVLAIKGNEEAGAVPYSLWVQNNGDIYAATGDASGLQSVRTGGGAFILGEWVHVATVADRTDGTLKIYVNGVERASGAIRKTATLDNDAPLTLGQHQGGRSDTGPLEGAIDSFRLWTTARTAAQIAADMASPPPVGTAGLSYALDFETPALDGTALVRDMNPAGVTGRIAQPGEKDSYSFTLAAATSLLFDSLTNNGGLNWTLTGPEGIVVESRAFDASDSIDFSPNPVLKLPAGEYTLSVDGAGDATGWYSFRLLDLASALPLTMSTPTTGALTPSTATAAYKFAANAGDPFFFDFISATNDIYWRLIDPAGNEVFGPQGMSDLDNRVLEFTGTYTLLLEGRVHQGTTSNYSIAVYPPSGQTAPLTLGARTEGTITSKGETDSYSFTLSAASKLVFDSLINQSQINWTLTGPNGAMVSARRFDQSDGANFGPNPVLNLDAGAYTLTIDGGGEFTGGYVFRLLDLASALAVVPGGTYNGTLIESGRETDMFRFTATKGLRFGFDSTVSISGSNRWRLIDPNGNVVFGQTTIEDTGLLTATMDGTYTLLVEGYMANAADANYGFVFDVPVQPAGTGQTVQTFDASGLPYVITNQSGPAAQVVSGPSGNFIRLTDTLATGVQNTVAFSANGDGRQDSIDLGFDFRVTRRAGQTTDPDGFGVVLLPVSLYGNGGPGPTAANPQEANVTGALGIGFDMVSNGEASANHISIHYNGTTQTVIANPGITLASGIWTHARILATRTAGGALLTIQLTQEGGATVTAVTDQFIAGLELEAIRAQISAYQGSSIGDQDFDNVSVAMTAAAAPMAPLTLGETVTGDVARAGGVYRYAFTITERTQVAFDALTNNGNIVWSLTGSGQTYGNRSFTNTDSIENYDNPVMTLPPGTYQVAIYANGSNTGSYAFRLNSLAAATPLTLGATQSLTLTPGSLTALYKLTGTAGQKLFMDYMSGSQEPWWRLIDPAGNIVFNSRQVNDFADVTLPVDGSYTLLIEGRIGSGGPQTLGFRVASMTDSSTAMTLGETVSGTIALPGERARYTFTMAESGFLLFDSLLNNSQWNWSLSGPSGVVEARTFQQDALQRSDAEAFKVPAGDYVLTIDPNGDLTGSFAFKLLELASASVLTLGAATSGRLDPGNSTQLFKFTAAQDDKFHFNMLSNTGYGAWRLLDPYGRLVFFTNYDTDVGPVTLEKAGSYTLLFEGRIDETVPVDFSFQVEKIVDQTAALTLGQSASGRLTQPGQAAKLTFRLDQPGQIVIDPLVADYDLSWTLSGPRGLEASREFVNSDAYGFAATPVFVLPAGDYTLTISNDTDTARDYAIRVHDLAQGIALTPGAPVSSTLSPAQETEVYRFDGAAGERFFFDRQALSSNSVYWRLIAPNGRQLWNGGFNDVDTYTLPDTGTYTLLVEGYVFNGATPISYGFNVFENPIIAPIEISSLEIVPGPDLVATQLAVTSTGAIESGSTVTFTWKTRNAGNEPTSATAWSDRIVVRNKGTGEIIANELLLDSGGALGVSAERQRQITITLPTGNRGAGELEFSVVSDVGNAVAEHNPDGTGENNNNAAIVVTSQLAPFTDLTVANVAPFPASGWKPGDTVTVNWKTTNAGNRATSTGFSERVAIRNLSTGEQFVLADIAVTAALDAGVTRDGSHAVTWPAGIGAHGEFEFVVTTDILDQVVEANDAGTGATNNSGSTRVISSPDLTIQNLAISNTAVSAGDTITIGWKELNLGNAATVGGWTNRVLVQNLSTGETLLNTIVASTDQLAGGASRDKSFSFALPHGVRSVGNVRVTVVVDSNANGGSTVREVADSYYAEGNNSSAVNTPVAARTYPDLQVTGVTAPANAAGGQPITVSWTVTNAGAAIDAAPAGWVDRVVLSGDDIFGNSDDIALGEFARTGALTAGGSYSGSGSVALPNNVGGNFRIYVVADPGNALVEPDTRADNVGVPAAIAIATDSPNLVTEAVFGPASTVFGGASFDVSWRVKNIGEIATATSFVDRIYLSADGVFDSGDLLLGERAQSGAIGVGESYSGTLTAALPSNRVGDYRLIVVSDGGSAVFESARESDNVGVSAAVRFASAPAANLVVDSVSVPAGAVPGQQIAVTYTVRNAGEIAATAPWSDRIYVGSGATIAGAAQLNVVARSFNLNPGESYEVTQTVTLPTNLSDGAFRFFVRADQAGQLFEDGREADNDLAGGSFQITHPDLVPVNVMAPDPLLSNSTFEVRWQVRNDGSGGTLGGWTDTIWLSRDDAVDGSDIKLGELARTDPLAAGGVYDGLLNVTLPIDAQGGYRLIVQSDSKSTVVEGNAGESNNQSSAALNIGLAPYSDLSVTNVTAPAQTINDPARVTVTWKVTNSGTGVGATTSWTDRIMVSRDDEIGDADDFQLAELIHSGGLAVGESYDASMDLILSPGFYGRYKLYVRSDAKDEVFENGADANRGTLAGNFDVSPIAWADLFVASVGVPTSALSGTEVTVAWKVGNQGIGLTNTAEWFDTIYLEKLDGTGRVRLGTANHLGFLEPGDDYERSATFLLPNGLDGQYRVVVEVPGSNAPGGTPYEFAFTGNNSATSGPITINLAPAPDLIVTGVTAPANGMEGEVVDVSWTVKNEGASAATGSWVDRVYLRKAGETGLGTLIGTYSYSGPLVAGQTYSRREEMRLPARTSERFDIVVVTDAEDKVYEHTGESNNRSVSDTTILVAVKPRPDLQVSEIIAPATVSAGGTASVEFKVVNTGTVAANGSWTDQVWLSLDDKISGDDILVSSIQNPLALESLGEYSSESATFTVPKRFRGTVYVLVAADAGNSIDEWPNDTVTSNVRAQALYVEPLPLADIVVDNVVTQAQAFEGNTVDVRYTVTNRGSGATDLGRWTEQVWLTRDKNRPHPGQGDFLLGTLTYENGILAKDAGYDRQLSVTLPTGLTSGTYYIMPWVDPYGTLLEDSLAINVNPDDPNEINSSNYKARAIQIVGTPPQAAAIRGVAVESVTAPASASAGSGEDFTVSWTVRATGDSTADGWEDRIILANAPLLENATRTFDLGGFDNLEALDPGQSYTNSATFKLNPAAAGLYVIVQSVYAADRNTLDNQAFAASNVTNAPADLRVTSVVPGAPASPAYSGEKTSVTYTVENQGAAVWAGTQYWTDQIWISKDPTFDRTRALKVADVQHSNATPLGAGASYTATAEWTMPPGVSGEYYVYVFTNVDEALIPADIIRSGSNDGLRDRTFRKFAFELPQGNVKSAQFPVVYREPDLQVTELSLLDTVAAGSTIEITFKVENKGNRATRETNWTDRVYLSLDASLDEGDWLMSREITPGVIVRAESEHVGVLQPGEFYYAKAIVTLPFELQGQFNVIAVADAGLEESGIGKSTLSTRLAGVRGSLSGKVREFSGEGNNSTAKAITLTPYVAPNLQVSALTAPERAVRGQKFSVSYTVTNAGGATPALQGGWDDLVYLSRDPFLDLTSDRFIGSISHSGGLNAGGSYTVGRDFNVPSDLGTEAYYVFVVTDPARYDLTGKVFETDERDNSRVSSVPMVIELPPPTDIQVTDIVVPDNLQSGDPVTVSWTVRNASDVPASGSWTDAVYLSRDASWDIADKLLGRGSFTGTLNKDGSYTLSLTTTLPGAAAGDYRVIVKADARNQLHEGTAEGNNTTASANAISISVETLKLDIPTTIKLQPGQEKLYRIEVPADQTLRFRLDSNDARSINEVFLRHDQVPTSALFDATYSGPLSEELTAIVPNTEPGVYYVLVRGYAGPAGGTDVTLLADLMPLVVTDIATDVGGDGKFVTTTITGAQFKPGAIVKLSRPNIAEYEPVAWQVVDSSKIIATFDFTDAPHGLYDVKIINPDGSETVEPYRFLIERGIEPEVTIGIGGPRVILAGDQATYSVALQNLSNLDAPYTFFQVGVPELNYNQYVYGLPFLDFFTNVRGTPEGAAGSANAAVPWINLESIVNTDGQLLTSGFLYDQPADGFGGFTFNVMTYPGLKAMADKNFEEFRARMANFFPELDGELAKGEGNLNVWWAQAKNSIDEKVPGAGAILDQLDFLSMYQQNTAVPSKDEIPFIPFRFTVTAAATTMTRAEYVAFQTSQAKNLRTAILAGTGALAAPPALLALAASEKDWVDLYLAGLETAGLLRPDGAVPPIRTQQHIVSLMTTLASGILFGPGGSEVRSTGDIPAFFEKVRGWYGNDEGQMADIEIWDPRKSDKYEGEVPFNRVPSFDQFDLGLSRQTHFESFRVFVPWIGFADRGAGLPADFQINGPQPVDGSPFATLDFSRFFRSQGEVARLASITGPSTLDTMGWLPEGQALPYSVGFENAAGSARYVNEIQIVTELDPDLDARSFTLGDIKIGDIAIDVPDGRTNFNTEIDFTRTRGFILRVNAVLDLYQSPGRASWLIQAIDPITGEVLEDATRGLLAPNNASGSGAGFVSYSINPSAQAVTGDRITASARVIMAGFAPEDTSVLSQMIDAQGPWDPLESTCRHASLSIL